MIYSLIKINFKNLFSFGFENTTKKSSSKFSPILKKVLFSILILFCVSSFILSYGMSSINLYKSLSANNQQTLMPLMSVFSGFFVILFFSFFTVSSSYFMGQSENQFLAMPLKPSELFASKYIISILSDLFIGAIILGTSSVIYGFKERLFITPLFYVGMILLMIAIPVIAVYIIYAFLILIFSIFPVLRKRKFLQTISIIFVLIFAFSLNYSDLYIKNSLENVSINTENYRFIEFFSSLLSGNIFAVLGLVFIIGIVLCVLVPAVAPFYVKTIYGFEDNLTQKSKKSENLDVSKEVQSSSLFRSLLVRDIRSVLREPAFFTNGPMMILVFPLIFLVSMFISFQHMENGNISELIQSISNFFSGITDEKFIQVKFMILLIFSSIVVFLGTMTNIAATSFSREGKFLFTLKAMPINYTELIKAKFYHSLMYCVLSWILVTIFYIFGIFCLKIPFAFQENLEIIIYSFALSMSISVFMIFMEMMIDTLNPKLMWENPTACVKQNLNAVLVMFMTIIVVLIVIVSGIFVVPKNMAGSFGLILFFVILSAIAGNAYFKYALKKLPEIQ